VIKGINISIYKSFWFGEILNGSPSVFVELNKGDSDEDIVICEVVNKILYCMNFYDNLVFCGDDPSLFSDWESLLKVLDEQDIMRIKGNRAYIVKTTGIEFPKFWDKYNDLYFVVCVDKDLCCKKEYIKRLKSFNDKGAYFRFNVRDKNDLNFVDSIGDKIGVDIYRVSLFLGDVKKRFLDEVLSYALNRGFCILGINNNIKKFDEEVIKK